ncbi:MAG: hypothetical protein IJM55_08110 [Ruminococcus sp.]|nr:hypothetical protein [Ruminococcus sp.]
MKKLLAILLACTALTCSFAGCGSKDSSDNGGSSAVEEAKSPVVGTWKLTGESFDDLKKETDERDWKLKEVILETDNEGNMTFTIRCETYGNCYLTEDTFYMGNNQFPVEYKENKVIIENGGKKEEVLEKIGDVDENDRNGVYKVLNPELKKATGLDTDTTMTFEFISKDESYWCILDEGKYEYNEEEKKMLCDIDSYDHGYAAIEFDGNKMLMTDNEGVVDEFIRIN